MGGEYYEQNRYNEVAASAPMGMSRKMTMREDLEAQLKYHQMQVAAKQELLQLLTDNPVIERFMDLSRT